VAVFPVYQIEMESDDRSIYAAVTNGMSDQRMADDDSADQPRRREHGEKKWAG
jgi:hypothetical protein